jgi:hypothetical protein
MKNLSFIALLISVVSFTMQAQIVINEFSVSNLESFTDSFGKTEDWIELYNTSDLPVNIGGWHLSDKENKPVKWRIPEGTVIDGNGFLLFLCSGRDLQKGNEFHTNFKLAQSEGKDIVLLSDASGAIVEMHNLDLTLVEHSRCRSEDGGNEWVVSTSPSYGTSNNNTPQVNGYTATPTIDLPAGYYEEDQLVTITNNEPNSTLRYTTDGTNVRSNSPIYTDPIIVTNTQVVKARSFSDDTAILPGKMDFNTYFINEDFSLAVFSVAADQVIDLANGNGGLIPIGSIEYFNLDKEREATSFGSLNRHGSWVLDHRSLDWVSRDEMGYSKAVNAPLFGFSDRDEYQKFMFRNSGDDNYPARDDNAHQGSTHVRDEYVQTLGQLGDMNFDLRAVERVILFLNGEYWGVYGMRDRPVDHDYTDEYYDQGKYDIQYLSTWGDTEIEYGGLQAISDWENIRNHVLLNDMSDPENYQIAEDSINMLSLIDYMTMNLNVVASDWLNYNTGWWRGLNPEGGHKKWGYILWDLDATFDYYINYSGVPDISPNAKPCDIEDIADFVDGFFGPGLTTHGSGAGAGDTLICNSIENGSSPYPGNDPIFQQVVGYNPSCCDNSWSMVCQDTYDFLSQFNGGDVGYNGNVGAHAKIFLKLIDESPIFKQLYYSRYADLMNTVFTCENMTSLLDSMIAVIEPEMPGQIERWGGTLTEWEENVERLRGFIEARCLALDETALECFEELDGPHKLTLQTRPNGVGEIDLNTLDIESFPWEGDYFGGMENIIKAKVFSEFEDEYVFSHWESSAGNIISPSETERKATIRLTQQDTLTAVFDLFSNTTDLSDLYDISIYPNPASSFIQLDIFLKEPQRIEAELISLTGKRVQQYTDLAGKNLSGDNSLKLPIAENVTTGIYFLSLKIGTSQKTYKVNVVKER